MKWYNESFNLLREKDNALQLIKSLGARNIDEVRILDVELNPIDGTSNHIMHDEDGAVIYLEQYIKSMDGNSCARYVELIKYKR